MLRKLTIVIALAVAVAGCSDSEGTAESTAAADDTTTEAPTTAAPTTGAPTTEAPTTAAPSTSEAPTTEAPTTEAPSTAGAESTDPSGASVAVELKEWEVIAPPTISAGNVTFEVSNIGTFTHEFAVARGDGYENLPQLANGAVDEETLGQDFLGRTENIPAGTSATISFDLEPGTYVFMCNIQVGPNAHAAQGQVLTVTVEA